MIGFGKIEISFLNSFDFDLNICLNFRKQIFSKLSSSDSSYPEKDDELETTCQVRARYLLGWYKIYDGSSNNNERSLIENMQWLEIYH